MVVGDVQRDVLIKTFGAFDGDVNLLRFARLEPHVIFAQGHRHDVTRLANRDGMHFRGPVPASAARLISLLVGQRSRADLQRLLAVRGMRCCSNNLHIGQPHRHIWRSAQHDTAILALVGEDAAARRFNAAGQAFDAQLNIAGESVLAFRANKDRAAGAGCQLRLVGVDVQLEARQAARCTDEVDKVRTAAQVQVADLDHEHAVGGCRPVLEQRVGRIAFADPHVVVKRQLLAGRVKNSEV